MAAKPQDSETSEDVELPLSENECTSLTSVRNALYREVMAENHKTMALMAAASIDRPDRDVPQEEERNNLVQRGWEVVFATYITRLRRYMRLIQGRVEQDAENSGKP